MARAKQCSVCNASFNCGDTLTATCWCNEFPPIVELSANNDCLCPKCLHIASVQKVEEYVAMVKQKGVAFNVAPKFATNTSFIPLLDYYIENGKWVFTSWYHLKRGTCCNNGCRHCPYGVKSGKSMV